MVCTDLAKSTVTNGQALARFTTCGATNLALTVTVTGFEATLLQLFEVQHTTVYVAVAAGVMVIDAPTWPFDQMKNPAQLPVAVKVAD
ncbi:MAG: hypothetical protein EAZ29_03080 [Runella slithyformis]|nr:MAG: hypothetical protein EAZ29_03080 [Runella slithyformis]